MPIDLPPNLQNTANAIVRAAEQTNVNLPKSGGSQADKNKRNSIPDATNARGADGKGSSQK